MTATRGPHETADRNPVVGVFNTLCEPCFERAVQGAELLRAEFEALLEAGWTREAANEFIIDKYRLDLPRADA